MPDAPAHAAVVHDGRHVRVEPQPRPEPGPGDALVAVEACGVPDALPGPIAALAERTAVAIRGVERSGLEPGERVLVLGAGPVGLLSIVAARAAGASEDWTTARHPHQAEPALRLSAERVLSNSELRAGAPGIGPLGFDRSIETVGGRDDFARAGANKVSVIPRPN